MNKTSPFLSRARASISRVLFQVRACFLVACAAIGLLETAKAVDGYNPRPNSGVLCMAYQADGKLIIGGHFTKIVGVGGANDFDRLHIARLNTDGSLDTGFYPSTDGDVSVLAIQPDGSIIIGGSFLKVTPSGSTQSVTRNGIARIKPDGSVDTSFAPAFTLSTGGDAKVSAIVRQVDGKLLIGGSFDAVKGSTDTSSSSYTYIVRLNADGSIDKSFDVKSNGIVKAIALQQDGAIIIGGGFTNIKPTGTINYTNRNRAARLFSDGTLDPAFNPSANNVVNSVLVQPNGAILIAGQFTNVTVGTDALATYDRFFIARFNADGSLDTTFYPSADSTILTMVLQQDGKIVIGGSFTQIFSASKTGNVYSNYVARINADGSADDGFYCYASQYVTSLAVQDDGKLLVGGWFTDINSGAPTLLPPIPFLARVYSDGSVDTDWAPGASSTVVTASAMQADGKMIITGNLASIAGVTFNGVARTLADGTIDPTFNCTLRGSVNQTQVLSDGRIVINGSFTTVNGVARSNIAILKSDGSLDTNFVPPTINSTVFQSAVQADGKVVIVGEFSLVGTTVRNAMARLNTDGSLDTAFDPNVNNRVYAVKVLSDGRILIGGNFSTITPNGSTTPLGHNCIAMLKSDGTEDSSFIPAFNAVIFDIQIQSDGKMLIGGNFSQLYTKASTSAVHRNYLVRLDSAGLFDSSFTTDINGFVSLIRQQADGKIVIGGNFTSVNTQTRNIIARLNSDGTIDPNYSPNPDNGLTSILLQSDGSIVYTGKFSTFQPTGFTLPVARSGLARVKADGTLDLNFGIQPPTSLIGEADVVSAVSSGALLVGGQFTNLAGAPSPNLARFAPNGVVDQGFSANPNGRVLSLLEMPMQSKIAVFANRFAWFNKDLTPRIKVSSLDFVDDGGRIYTALPMADGSAIIAGRFTIKGITRNITNMAHIKADGTLDETFAPEPNTYVNAVKILSTGKFIVGGGFTTIGGAAKSYVARLNADGTADTDFNIYVNSSVETIGIQPDGQIILAGNFTTLSTDNTSTTPYSTTYIARLTAAGAPDTTYSPILDGMVKTVAFQSDGKAIIGGLFTSVQGVGASSATSRLRMARLNTDGSLDQNFDPSMSAEVISIAVQPDDKIVAGGSFYTITPNLTATNAAIAAGTTTTDATVITAPYLVRLNNDGTQDTTFMPAAPNSYINQVLVASDGTILVGGQFTAIGSVAFPFVAHFSSTGVLDTSFKPDSTAPVFALAVSQKDGSILTGGSLTIMDNESMVLAGGEFTTIGNEQRKYLALLSRGGISLSSFQATPDGAVNAMARQDANNVIIAGSFKNVSGKARGSIARIQLSGIVDDSFNPNADGLITAMVLQTDGRILVAGSFANIAGTSRQGIARLNADGSIDATFNPGVTGSVSALSVDEQGRILVGGAFTGIAGSGSRYIVRLSSTGIIDSSFTATTDGPVYAVAPVIGGRISIGGAFTKVGSQTRANFAQLDKNGNLIADSSTGTNATVRSIATLLDGKVAIGGSFTKVNGDSHYLVARTSSGVLVKQSFFINSARDTLTWTRTAGSPLVNNVRFEYSTDSDTWTALGGTPTVSADSQTITLTGISLPPNTQCFVRARGYVPVTQGGAGSMLQQVWSLYLSPITLPNTADTVLVKGSVVSVGGVVARNGLSFSSSDLPPGLSIDPSTGRIYGTPTTLGNYLVHVHYSDQFTSGDFTQNIQVAAGTGNQTNGAQVQRLLAYSTRATSSGANPLIIGFVVKGTDKMPVLLRAVGPGLASWASGVDNPLAAPKGSLYRITSQGAELQFSLQNWSDATGTLATTTARVGAQPLVVGSKDVSTVANLEPGAYTWVVTDSGSNSGVVLAEVYDANAVGAVNPSRLADCSTRGYVNATDRIIAGYLIDGNSSKGALLQAVGPSLSAAVGDLLNNPVAVLHQQDGTPAATNDNWSTQSTISAGWATGTSAQVAAAIQSMGATSLPVGSKDSALLVNMPSGVYTFEVTSGDTDSGNVLIEVYLP